LKDTLWVGIWSREHNNIRYAELLPRLSRVDARYLMLSSSRYLRAAQWRVYPRLQPYLVRWLWRGYRCLWCTNLSLIPQFSGDVIVDIDDPRFSDSEMALLNHPRVRAVVTTTDQLREQLLASGLLREVHVIPPGVNLGNRDKQREEAVAREQRGPGDIVIGLSQPLLSVAPPGHKAGPNAWPDEYSMRFLLDVMERVWPAVPEARLWLIGQPHPSLIEIARSRSAIHLLGYVPHEHILSYLANLDIAVYPRLVDFQGRFSIKLLEYMACGVPIVSTSVGESFLVTEANSGLVAKDVEDFADALIQLSRDAGMRRQLGAAGRRFAAGYDWDIIAARYEREVFERYFGPLLEA